MKFQVLDRAKKKKLLKELSVFGITKIPFTLVKVGKERIRAFSGALSTEEIYNLSRFLPLEGIGVYVAKEHVDRSGIR